MPWGLILAPSAILCSFFFFFFFARNSQDDSYSGRCEVRGSLPRWFKGTLFRTGPGLWEVGTRQLRQFHDGESDDWWISDDW